MIYYHNMVKIRLTQTGTRNRKQYRIIAIDKSKRRDGRALEILGFYNPLVKPAVVKLDQARIDFWLSQGAQLTQSVKNLMEKQSK